MFVLLFSQLPLYCVGSFFALDLSSVLLVSVRTVYFYSVSVPSLESSQPTPRRPRLPSILALSVFVVWSYYHIKLINMI